jgi:hypothetical protein
MTIACQQHFYKFVCPCLCINDVTLNSLPIATTNQIFYLYALILSIGETINGTLAKATTIQDYLTSLGSLAKDLAAQ